MQRAVVGFFFNPEKTTVVLIRKERPDWQKGLLNGVGGKVEEGEFALDAMIREFEEETGHHVEDWEPFCTHVDETHGYVVHFFRSFGDVTKCATTTDEKIVRWSTSGAVRSAPVIPNLTWLVPLALDPDVYVAKTRGKG